MIYRLPLLSWLVHSSRMLRIWLLQLSKLCARPLLTKRLVAKFKSAKSSAFSFLMTWLNILDPTTLRPLTTQWLFKQSAALLATRALAFVKQLPTVLVLLRHTEVTLSPPRLIIACKLSNSQLNSRWLEKSTKRKLKQRSFTTLETTQLPASVKLSSSRRTTYARPRWLSNSLHSGLTLFPSPTTWKRRSSNISTWLSSC